MPRVDRRTIGKGLVLVRRMVKQIIEFLTAVKSSQIDFLDGVSETVAAITRSMRVTGIRRLHHENADKSRAHLRCGKLESHRAALAIGNDPGGKIFPFSVPLIIHG